MTEREKIQMPRNASASARASAQTLNVTAYEYAERENVTAWEAKPLGRLRDTLANEATHVKERAGEFAREELREVKWAATEELTEAKGILRGEVMVAKEKLMGGLVDTKDFVVDEAVEVKDRVRRGAIELKAAAKNEMSIVYSDVKEHVRGATLGRVENVATSIGDTLVDARTVVVNAVKRRPLPYALLGIGVGWLALEWMSTRR